MKKEIWLSVFVCMILSFSLQAQMKDSTAVKKVGFAGIPNLSFDRSRGFGFGANLMMMVRLDKAHPKAPPSQFSLTGSYTTKKDWLAFAFSRLFLNNDRYRLTLGGGYLNSNFQTFIDLGGEQIEVPYNTHGTLLFAAPSIRVYDRFYVGINGQYFDSYLTFDDSKFSSENSHTFQNALGATIMYDSKNDQSYPTKGLMAAILFKSFPSWLDDDSVFNKFNAIANYYYSITSKMVLASRFAISAALGSNVPFVAQSYIGNKDIRGYTKGEYRGDQTYALQSELRWNLYKKFGAVGFFGLAVANSPGETSPLLPGGGVGLRYKILPSFKLNIGIDAALGKDDWGIYFRIGEAF